MGAVPQDAALLGGGAHATSPKVVELTDPRDEFVARHLLELARDEGLDGDVVEIAAESDHAGENERLARDVDSLEIGSRIGLGVAGIDRGAKRV